ncbi:MAG TPA: protocatechuate 3,4-dioxygenase subunit alpha [Burkholderiales bacterium]|nr:protocatechuate 3,4-dioxygenase subunit alpha [Burkholderiales bacterium]
MALQPTGEMTLGPFFPREFGAGNNDLLASNGLSSPGIVIEGKIVQADGRALDNVIVEIWQASPAGRYDDPAFFGWGRAATDAQGVYRFRTVMPGAPAGRAPHVNVIVLYSGLMRQLQTVMFFDASPDPVLDAVDASRKALLVGKKRDNTYTFDIRLRGEGETPFFDD